MRDFLLCLSISLSLAIGGTPFAFSQVVTTAATQMGTPQFPGSGGVKIGPDGHVYIGNYGDGLQNSNGTQVWRYKVAADSLEVFATGLSGASGNDFDSQGNFYQSNIAAGTVSKITPSGSVSTFATGLSAPVGILVDSNDELYVCNCGNNTISRVDTSGNVSLFSSGAIFGCPNGITMDHNGNFYVSNFNNGVVIRITPTGVPFLFSTIPGSNNGHLTYAAVDSSIYLASHGSSRIYRISLTGQFSVVAGSGARGNDDGPTASATFSRPNGIAVSATGDTIYVNSSIPTTNTGFPLNPSVLRIITGLNVATGLASDFRESMALRIISEIGSQRKIAELEFEDPNGGRLRLIDVQGRLLFEETIPHPGAKEKVEFRLPDGLAIGLYILSLETSQGGISRRYIVD